MNITVSDFIDKMYSCQRGILYILEESDLDAVWDRIEEGTDVFKIPNDIEVIVAIALQHCTYKTSIYLKESIRNRKVENFIIYEKTGEKFLFLKNEEVIT